MFFRRRVRQLSAASRSPTRYGSSIQSSEGIIPIRVKKLQRSPEAASQYSLEKSVSRKGSISRRMSAALTGRKE